MSDIVKQLTKLNNSLDELIVSNVAGAMITASARPWSIEEAHELMGSIHFALRPAANLGVYEAWKKKYPENLAKVWK